MEKRNQQSLSRTKEKGSKTEKSHQHSSSRTRKKDNRIGKSNQHPLSRMRKKDNQMEKSNRHSLSRTNKKASQTKEQLALVIGHEDEDEEFDSQGEECELHVYERRLDTRGEEVCLRAGTKARFDLPKRRSHQACLVLNRHYTSQGRLRYTELEIQSRHIIKALREVIGIYPGVDLTSKFVTIREPPRCLFHYQDELRVYAESSNNHQLKSHMDLCLQYMKKTLHREVKISKSIGCNKFGSLELKHRHLWILFKPGCLVYHKRNNHERLSRLQSIYKVDDDGNYDDDDNKMNAWMLTFEIIGFNAGNIGLTLDTVIITRDDGYKPVCDLEVVPLPFHPEEERIRHDLLERGQKFLSLHGLHHCFFDGTALLCTASSPNVHQATCANVCVSDHVPSRVVLN